MRVFFHLTQSITTWLRSFCDHLPMGFIATAEIAYADWVFRSIVTGHSGLS